MQALSAAAVSGSYCLSFALTLAPVSLTAPGTLFTCSIGAYIVCAAVYACEDRAEAGDTDFAGYMTGSVSAYLRLARVPSLSAPFLCVCARCTRVLNSACSDWEPSAEQYDTRRSDRSASTQLGRRGQYLRMARALSQSTLRLPELVSR